MSSFEASDIRMIEENVPWSTLFERWAKREEDDKGWQECATKVKGWEGWREWRTFMAEQFGASQRKWAIYQILNPNEFLPKLQVGPFQGPQNAFLKGYQGEPLTGTFEDAARLNGAELVKNSKVSDMIHNFPLETELLGIRFPNGDITCMEGTHRSLATAIAKSIEQPIDFSVRKLTIAITEFTEEERKILSDMLKRGSNKTE